MVDIELISIEPLKHLDCM